MNPAKRLAIESVRRLGLLKPAFRLYQEIVALKTWTVESEFRALDGLPVPPPRLRVMVSGTADPAWFLNGGADLFSAISTDFGSAKSVLDFGCGCGRVLRHWQNSGVDLHGCDINPVLVDWCTTNLPFAQVQLTGAPPLPYRTGQFDAVYSVSVFTHLAERDQRIWMQALARIIKPNGLLLITTHAGTPGVMYPEASGLNVCIAFHSPETVSSLAAGLFRIEKHQPTGKLYQDLYLLRRLTS